MAVGLGAGGALGVALETAAAPGTWVAPTQWVPILNENLNYAESRYFSEAIKQKTIHQGAVPGYYHVEGDVGMEFDTRFVPYFLHGSRLSVTKTGTGPWTYKFVPSSGATIPASNRTLSITVVRNGVVYGYFGCQITSFDITIDAGVLRFNCHVIGRGEASQTASPAYLAAQILGAQAHTISVGDGAQASGAMAGVTPVLDFNGFTFAVDDNGAAQNRIIAARSAAYISYGVTAASVTTQLDFQNRTEYDKFVSAASKKVQLVSSGAVPANDAVTVNVYNSVYEDYAVALGSWADLIMANANFHVIDSGGTNPAFDVSVVTSVSNITPA